MQITVLYVPVSPLTPNVLLISFGPVYLCTFVVGNVFPSLFVVNLNLNMNLNIEKKYMGRSKLT